MCGQKEGSSTKGRGWKLSLMLIAQARTVNKHTGSLVIVKITVSNFGPIQRAKDKTLSYNFHLFLC